ncbi:MAG: Preprotein translocase subunit SecG (TC 3.A.5.1.1) [uncultured Campylobacterales bacterium]|uniref:Protein-export membrane protein SecG n=1 Tax=uncultured Campylobacterales bacterium TaxID=352960 RepID=A0A6S6T5Z2_9BACT|nr:MAG: Preprotein translocase subunit SecG (TC 3.A.5.1.1) [uncultured Campylobacterales bacterium]
MISVLFILQFVFAGLITLSVILQKSSSIGLGAYSGSNDSMFGAKGSGGFMSKLTFTVGVLFLLNTVALGYLYNQDLKVSVAEDINVEQSVPSSIPLAPISE